MTNDTQNRPTPPTPEQVLIARLVLIEARRLLAVQHGPTASMIERATKVTDLADRWCPVLWPDKPMYLNVEPPVVMFEDVEGLPRSWRPSRALVQEAVSSLAETVRDGWFSATTFGRDVSWVREAVRAYAATLEMARVFSGIEVLLPERLWCGRCLRRTVVRGTGDHPDACTACGRTWGE